jgi:hypothetical protein
MEVGTEGGPACRVVWGPGGRTPRLPDYLIAPVFQVETRRAFAAKAS